MNPILMISVLQVMMQLGTDEAGAEIRAKMQSASLLSDMESFKVSLSLVDYIWLLIG